jgi:hypothetical protein
MARKPTLFLPPGIVCDPWVWEAYAVAMAAVIGFHGNDFR